MTFVEPSPQDEHPKFGFAILRLTGNSRPDNSRRDMEWVATPVEPLETVATMIR